MFGTVFLPLWLVFLAMFSLGLAWMVAALQVYLRDTAQVLRVVLIAWFWLTPVFLPEVFYRGRLDTALEWNPVRYAVVGYRDTILGGTPPSLSTAAAMCFFALIAPAGGGLFFRHARKGFPDVI